MLPFCFCMSGLAEQGACDSTMLSDWSSTGSTEWLTQLFCDCGAQLGTARGRSSFDVTEANTLHDMYVKPPLDDKCAAQAEKLKWMVANSQWFKAALSCMFVPCVSYFIDFVLYPPLCFVICPPPVLYHHMLNKSFQFSAPSSSSALQANRRSCWEESGDTS